MIKQNLSLLVQCIYLILTGIQLLFIPNLLLGIFGFDPTHEVWINVLGIVTLVLATFYAGIYRSGDLLTKKYSIYGRLIAVIGFVLLVVSGRAKSGLILFAAFDLATAIWSWMELKMQNAPAQ